MKLRDYKENTILLNEGSIEAAVFKPTPRNDYGNRIYTASIYLKSGNIIQAELNENDKTDIEKLLGY